VPSEISNGDGEGNVKKIVLIAHDTLLQVAPDNQMKPGGVLYDAMTVYHRAVISKCYHLI
jgi:hypothetical protein